MKPSGLSTLWRGGTYKADLTGKLLDSLSAIPIRSPDNLCPTFPLPSATNSPPSATALVLTLLLAVSGYAFRESLSAALASEFRVDLIPERLLKEGQVFSGDTSVMVRTDQFLVEGVDVVEEPALEGKGKVVFRGEIRFDDPVNPEVLDPRIRLAGLDDPRAPPAGGGHAGDVLRAPPPRPSPA